MNKKLTIEDVRNFVKYCLFEHDLPISLNQAKNALLNFDTNEERIEDLKKQGQPAIGFADGRSWEEHAKENMLKNYEWLRDEK